MTRCPLSLARFVKVSQSGWVVYKAEKAPCNSFPGDEGMQLGPKRNYQTLYPLNFLAELTQHIPAQGSRLIHYYGWYFYKNHGMRKKAADGNRCGPSCSRSRNLYPRPTIAELHVESVTPLLDE